MTSRKRNIGWLALAILTLPFVLFFVILKVPTVQTYIAQKIAQYYSNQLHAVISIDKFSFDWGLNAHLENLMIRDDQLDTLLYVQDFKVADYQYNWDDHLTLSKIDMSGLKIRLIKDVDGVWNFHRLQSYFESLAKGEQDTTASLLLDVTSFRLNNVSLDFCDNSLKDASHLGKFPDKMKWQLDELVVSDFKFNQDEIRAGFSLHNGKELCGFSVNDVTGQLAVSKESLNLSPLHFKSNRSDVKAEIAVSASDYHFFDFEKAQWSIDLHALPFHTSDLSVLFPGWLKPDRSVYGNLRCSGNAKNLDIQNLQFSSGRLTRADIQGKLRNLDNIDSLFTSLEVKNIQTDDEDLRGFLSSFHLTPDVIPKNVSTLGLMTYQGFIQSSLSDWRMYGNFETSIGNVNGDVDFQFQDIPSFNGFLDIESFDLGQYYYTDQLGSVSANLDVHGQGLSLKELDVKAYGEIQSIEMIGYVYHDITVDGAFKNKAFDGDIVIRDVNMDVEFEGGVDFSRRLPELTCQMKVKTANLKEIGLFTQFPYSTISGSAALNAVGLNPDDFVGDLTISDLSYCTEKEDYVLDFLSLNVDRDDDLRVVLNSDIAFGVLKGQFTFQDVLESFKGIAAEVIPKAAFTIEPHLQQRFDLDLEIMDFSQISAAFSLGIGMSQNARLNISVDETQSYFDGTFVADSISTNDFTIYGGLLDISKPDEAIYASVRCDSVQGDNTWVESMSIDARAEEGLIYFDWVWGEDQSLHSGDLGGKFIWNESNEFEFNFYRGDLRLKSEKWQIREGSAFAFKSDYIRFDNLALQTKNQSIEINGEMSKSDSAPLLVAVNNVDFASINAFLPASIQLKGTLNGGFALTNVFTKPIWTSNLNVDDFGINQEEYGDIFVESAWNEKLSCIQLAGGINKLESSGVSFNGLYFPNDSINPIDIDAKLSQFDLSFIQSFVDSTIVEIDGLADAEIKITGTIDNPQLFGSGVIKQGKLGIDYLRTSYLIEDRVWIEPDRFVFKDVQIKDENGSKGKLTGFIGHRAFSEWSFDVLADLEKEPMRVLNTTEWDNPDYYGKAFATGFFHLLGTTDNLGMSMALKTAAGTKLNLPMSGGEVDEFGQFIHFVSKKSTILQENLPMDLSGISLDIQIDITPEAELAIIFDEAVGDVMKGKGSGHISLGISKLATFDMYGQIEIASGSYLFTLKNLINKEFQIQPGGTIAWFGNPYEAELNLNALYKVNASLSDVLADQTAVSGQRVPVDLVMNLKGKMLNPNVDFKIDLPSVDPLTKSRFESVVSTEQERNRQAFALLVLRQFVSPPNIVKAANTSTNNLFVENSTELLSSQISNWLSQISDDFNLGFNYRSGDQISNEEVALALSTQLFDNRVQLSGNFGVSRGNAVNQQPSNYIGDVKVEYLLTKEGKLKLIAYNESNNYRNVSTQQSPYTQGVGIVYQQEFNQWKDLVKRKK